MTSAAQLADRLDATIRHDDALMAIYKCDLTHPERWPLVDPAVVERHRSDLLRIADEAERAAADDAHDTALLDAVAYGGRATAIRLTNNAELTWISPANGLMTTLVNFLPRHVLPTSDHGDRYLTRLAGLAPFVDEWAARLIDGARAGIVPNEQLANGILERLDGLVDGGFATAMTHQRPPADLDDAAAARWTGHVTQLVVDDAVPAIARLRDVVADHTLPAARPDDRPGLVHLDGGDELYRQVLWSHTSVGLSPEDVHALGLGLVEQLADEYREIAGPVLGTDDIAEIMTRLRDDESMRYTDAERLVADATAALRRAEAASTDWFHRLPVATCTPNPIEQGALAFYSPPAPDGSKGGEFFFQTSDPSSWGTFQLEAVTFHESIPGHHLQLALAIENDAVHPLMQEYLVPAYCEGWGLYTERLADEMGLYSSQMARIGMLAADSMRACRLVVDTGIHGLGWSMQQAIDYLVTNAPLSHEQVVGEVERYVGNPGQACSYMIGRIAIDEARADAERRMGDRFDIRAFHDVVLGWGAVPLDTLRRLVADWATAD